MSLILGIFFIFALWPLWHSGERSSSIKPVPRQQQQKRKSIFSVYAEALNLSDAREAQSLLTLNPLHNTWINSRKTIQRPNETMHNESTWRTSKWKKRTVEFDALINVVEFQIAFYFAFYQEFSQINLQKNVHVNVQLAKYWNALVLRFEFYTLVALAVAKHNKHSIAWHRINESSDPRAL